jgi:DNA recombination protein RmuC
MDLNSIFLIILILLAVVSIVLIVILIRDKRGEDKLLAGITDISRQLTSLERNLKEEFRINREEVNRISRENREELAGTLRQFGDTFDRSIRTLNELQREKFGIIEKQQDRLTVTTEKKLEDIRTTVDEKLQKTLNERLGQSFELVGKQLESVQQGLGEMQSLAQDVGGLKRALSNVKIRGGIGEVQLAMLLEQILAPDQYEANVRTKTGSADTVEFAIRLPGREEPGSTVWLPVDAKFPRDVYENLQNAYDTGDPAMIEPALKNLEITIRRMARDIRDKYVDPPNTTDFAIMFLPFEGIYAEVVRKASLLEELQRTTKVVVTGPTTLAAILNSLQMGFRTLAIQRRSSEVWKVLGEVKKEFESFGGLLTKAQGNIQAGLSQLDDVMGKRTRAIERRLRGVETGEIGEQ